MQPDRQKWQMLALGGLAVVLSLTTWFSATAVGPELARDLGLSAAQIGWLTNAVQLGFVVGALMAAVLAVADVVPLTRLMAGAAVFVALANGAILISPGVEGIIAARFATGLGLALVYPPAMKFIATWFQTGRGLALGAMVGALTLGSALPHLLRALADTPDWRVVVIGSSMLALISSLIFISLREGPYGFAKAKVDPRQIGAILRNRPVMLANLGYFGHMWELYAMWGWFLAYASAAQSLGGWDMNLSILVFAVVAMGAPGCVMAGWLSDRIGRCRTTALAMGISGSCAVLIGVCFDAHPAVFALIALIWGLTIVADSAQFSAAVTELSDQTLVGSALAFQMGVGFAITIFVIWLVPHVAGAWGWRWTFLILAPGPMLGTWAMLALRHRPEAVQLAGGRR